MSANGGSWSHTKVEYNNTVKAIKFETGDIVHGSIDHLYEKIASTKTSSLRSTNCPSFMMRRTNCIPAFSSNTSIK
jgi:hypothetical protein